MKPPPVTFKARKVVLRLTRHAASSAQISELRRIFGDDTDVVTTDCCYGDNPLAAVTAAIEAQDGPVVACDIVAPWPVLARLVGPLRERGIKVIRAEMRRGPDGRVLNPMEFSHWVSIQVAHIEVGELDREVGCCYCGHCGSSEGWECGGCGAV